MNQWVRMYAVSVSTLRSVMPVIGALVAIRPEHTNIATSIPGLGTCKSTYCKPERRVWASVQ